MGASWGYLCWQRGWRGAVGRQQPSLLPRLSPQAHCCLTAMASTMCMLNRCTCLHGRARSGKPGMRLKWDRWYDEVVTGSEQRRRAAPILRC